MKKQKIPNIEALVQEYYNNPIICLAFGVDYYNRQETDEERDKEIIRGYVRNFYLQQEEKK